MTAPTSPFGLRRQGGDLLWQQAIDSSEDPDALALGEKLEMAVGALILEQATATGETEAMAQRACTGRIDGGVYVQWHTGSPGTAGGNNIITELGRTLVAQGSFTVT